MSKNESKNDLSIQPHDVRESDYFDGKSATVSADSWARRGSIEEINSRAEQAVKK
jgi:hypothetical protein